MVLYAVLAERVKAGERLGVLVALQTDLADQKFIVNLLRELGARRRRHLELVLLLSRYVWTQSSADRLQHIDAKYWTLLDARSPTRKLINAGKNNCLRSRIKVRPTALPRPQALDSAAAAGLGRPTLRRASAHSDDVTITRKLCYHKDDRAMRRQT